jgi:membrane fusion protein, heavy metal efflux system
MFEGFTMSDTPIQKPVTAHQAEGRLGTAVVWKGFRRALPTATVVFLLGGLACWGHYSDWNIPKFSSLVHKNVHQVDDWCDEHNVPESQCIECNPKLVPNLADYGWCPEHGVNQCPLDHPDIAQLKEVAHLSQADFARANRALALMPRPENDPHCHLYQRRIQFASTQAAEKVGLEVAVVEQRPIVEAIVANGELVYDQTRMAHLSCRAPGTVWRVERKVGEHVAKGDVLALVDAAEVGRAKADFLQAVAQFRLNQKIVERMRPGAQSGAVPERMVLETETAFQESKIRVQSAQQALVNLGLPVRVESFAAVDTDQIAARIQFLGLPGPLVARLDRSSTTSNLIPVCAPLDGVVVGRDVVEGEVIDRKTILFAIADVSRLWLILNVRQDDARYLSVGQRVLFRASDNAGEPEIQGALSWISTAADEPTRTVKVRVNLPNLEGRLKANTFGTGRIVLRQEPKATVVPSEAIHWDGSCSIVFVRDKNWLKRDAPKFFYVRSVRPGVKNGGVTEIIAGLLPGEIVAARNSVVLEAQLLKSNLGPGCGCAEGH